MKTTLYFTLTLLTFVTLTFAPNSFVQDYSPEYVVRQIYFHPSDRQPPQDIDTTFDALVNDVQQFYADEMERHGFGRKTFRLETDAQGKTVRYHVKGKFTNAYYLNNTNARKEINEQFNLSEHFIFLIFFDWDDPVEISPRSGGSGAGHPFAGIANITLTNYHKAPSTLHRTLHRSVFNTVAHELGHAFGLPHDFRDDRYMMSYGPAERRGDQLSYCAAEWLDVHRYFNTVHNSLYQVPTINMLEPAFVSSPNTIRLRFEITHSARLHQAQLLTNSFSHVGYPSRKTRTLIINP